MKYFWSLFPVIFLVAFLSLVIHIYGIDALSGPSQLVLILSTGIAAMISIFYFKRPWKVLEEEIGKSIGSIGAPIVILLLIGMLSGTWMTSGIVPTFIYYGMQLINPRVFLLSSCVISAIVSVMTGSSWTTEVHTGVKAVDELLATRGMQGMLNTIWIILCAICFGGVLKASGMLQHVVELILPLTGTRVGLVASTVVSGIFFNATAADQFLSIMLNASMFSEIYKDEGYEPRLLSRSIEDSSTVTSVLIPWSTCGMTQSTVLGVPTLTYLPYCFFNLLAPLVSITVAAIGYKIYRNR